MHLPHLCLQAANIRRTLWQKCIYNCAKSTAITLSHLKYLLSISPQAVRLLKITDLMGKTASLLSISANCKGFLNPLQSSNSYLTHYSIFRKKVMARLLMTTCKAAVLCVSLSGCLICRDQSPPAVSYSLTSECMRLPCQLKGAFLKSGSKFSIHLWSRKSNQSLGCLLTL